MLSISHFEFKNHLICWVCFYCLQWSGTFAFAQTPQDTSKSTESSAATISSSDQARAKRIKVEKNIVFSSHSGEDVCADVYRPNNDSKLPMIVLIHGGAWITGDKWNFADHARQLADEGFVVASINYRLAPKSRYPAQLIDCQEAMRWVGESHERWNADVERLGVWGYSAGAQLAMMLALKPREDSPKLRCCVVGGLPSDMTMIPEDSQLLSAVFGGTRREKPELYREASPSYFVHGETPPIFQYHGSDDFMVPIGPALEFHEKLQACGVECRFEKIEKSGHLMTFLSQESRKSAIEFLKDQLCH